VSAVWSTASCISIVIDAVTVTISNAVAVSITIAIANHHFFQKPFS
jgi:hypothetical protein